MFESIKTTDKNLGEPVIFISKTGTDTFRLSENNSKDVLYEGDLGIRLASILYDRVIFHLLNTNNTGIALHAGAISSDNNIALIPGKSGAGKSTLVAWLVAHGFTYLTDELVFYAFSDKETISFFFFLDIYYIYHIILRIIG